MAHVEKRTHTAKDGKTSVRWRARYRDPSGRERVKLFERKVDAEKYLAETEVAKTRRMWIDPTLAATWLEEWAKRWLEVVRPALTPKTAASYESLLRSRILPGLGARRSGSLRPSDVQVWVAALQAEGLSASRIRQAQVVLASALDAAVGDGLLARNPARGARLPKLERKEAAYFEPGVVEAIAGEIGEYGLLVLLLGQLGPRFGEAAALRRSSVDLLRRRLRIERSVTEVSGHLVEGRTKGHAQRSLPIPTA